MLSRSGVDSSSALARGSQAKGVCVCVCVSSACTHASSRRNIIVL